MNAGDVKELRAAADAAHCEYEATKRNPCATSDEIARSKKRFHKAHEQWLDAAPDAASAAFR